MKKPQRIKTIFGVAVPPWRHEPVTRSMTMVFLLTGRIPSKKNELIAVVDRADAFKYMNEIPGGTMTKTEATTMLFKTFARIKNAPEYEQWEAAAVQTFTDQLKAYQKKAASSGIIFPVPKATVQIKLYWKGKYRRDNTNKSEGIHDALVKAQVIADDSDRCTPDTSQKARDYSDIIPNSIALIFVTVPLSRA